MSKKIEAPQGIAAGRDVLATAAPATTIQSVSGSNNIIGNQGPLHVQIAVPAKRRVNVVVPTGPEHIDGDQKNELTALRDDWIALHGAIKKKPLGYGAAQGRINKAVGATSYHLILRDRFQEALAFVKQEMAKLRNMRSAPTKDADWRASRIGAIKARCKNQLGDPAAYKAYIKKTFGAESLTDLSTDELQRTYSYIMAKKN
jgi:hypothetical protein